MGGIAIFDRPLLIPILPERSELASANSVIKPTVSNWWALPQMEFLVNPFLTFPAAGVEKLPEPSPVEQTSNRGKMAKSCISINGRCLRAGASSYWTHWEMFTLVHPYNACRFPHRNVMKKTEKKSRGKGMVKLTAHQSDCWLRPVPWVQDIFTVGNGSFPLSPPARVKKSNDAAGKAFMGEYVVKINNVNQMIFAFAIPRYFEQCVVLLASTGRFRQSDVHRLWPKSQARKSTPLKIGWRSVYQRGKFGLLPFCRAVKDDEIKGKRPPRSRIHLRNVLEHPMRSQSPRFEWPKSHGCKHFRWIFGGRKQRYLKVWKKQSLRMT